MKIPMLKTTTRSIRFFPGRYMALLLIVMLSVGFYAGLKLTTTDMVQTCEDYVNGQKMYDYRLISTLGFTEKDVSKLADPDYVSKAEGTVAVDAMMEFEGNATPYRVMQIPEETNLPSLAAGEFPKASDECLVDAAAFSVDDIGKTIVVSENNEDSTLELFAGNTKADTTEDNITEDNIKESAVYTITGLADTPLYLGIERGSTNMGSGALTGFIYLTKDAFDTDIFTEISILLTDKAYVYSDAYDSLIRKYKSDIKALTEELAEERYYELAAESKMFSGMMPRDMIDDLAAGFGLEKPDVYVLTRNENAGYLNFENDTSIVGGVANIFPLFFILIAMLVCITTMSRMVEEERTQIGTFKALGYSNGAIMGKYLMYAGSATVIGWAIGYLGGAWGIPEIFWMAYGSLYNFAPLSHVTDIFLALLTLFVALAGILGAAVFACAGELKETPAGLIRPKPAKGGKRIFLERITPLWSRLSFLRKATLRNMFRYKRRFVMMIIGVSSCCALVLVAFGVRDTMIDTGSLQFDLVQTYDLDASYKEGKEEDVRAGLDELVENGDIADYLLCTKGYVDVSNTAGDVMTSITMYSIPIEAVDTKASGSEAVSTVSNIEQTDAVFSAFWKLHQKDTPLSFPQEQEAVISRKVAQKLKLEKGDQVTFTDSDHNECTVTVCGIFDNYVDNFVFIGNNTYENTFGTWKSNNAMIHVTADFVQKDSIDKENGQQNLNVNLDSVSEKLTEISAVTSVAKLSDRRAMVDNALSCLNYIIWLIVLFSGALAFIVIFNLTNINLAERSREVATVEVLGFYPEETRSYVLWENLALSAIAGVIGLPLGVLAHRVVMDMIQIDAMAFDYKILPQSYLLALGCTLVFAVIVNRFMRRKIEAIHMAESLKAVE